MDKPFDPYRDWLGIQAAQRPLSYYQLLRLGPFETDAAVIARAADRQIETVRAFISGPNSRLARRTLFELESAKKCLLDPASKRAYDESLRGRRIVQPLKDGSIATSSQRSLQPWEEALAESAATAHPPAMPPAFPSGGADAELYHKWLGIPVSEQPANHYRLLGIADLESDSDVIASAADRQMAHVRTFQIGQHSAASQRILNEIAGARLCLLNEKRKTEYDIVLRTRLASQALGIPVKADPNALRRTDKANPKTPRRAESKTRLIVACAACGCLAAAAVVFVIASIFNRTEPAVSADAKPKPEPEVVIQRPTTIPSQSPPPQRERVVDQNGANAAFGGYSGFGGPVAATRPREIHGQAVPPAPDGSAAETSDGDARTQWINESYHITLRHLQGKKWAEFDSTGHLWAQYEETGRTKDYIELFRQDRQQKQRVLSDRTELFQNGKWEWVATGSWAAAPQETARTTSLQSTSNPSANETLSDVIERVEKSVVRINVTGRGLTATGSGFIAGDGDTVVTNYHVIENALDAEVEFQDGERVKVVGYAAVEPRKDIAILRLASSVAQRHIPQVLAAQLPRQGDHVCSIGAPRGLSFSASDGIVSAVRKGSEFVQDQWMAANYDRDMTWIQTTAPISPGNSGGPLISAAGEIVAMNTWCRTDGQNLNFGVSTTDIAQLLNQRSNAVQLLTTLPRKSAPENESPSIRKPDERIVLPSGKVVDIKTDFLDELNQRLGSGTFFPTGRIVANLNYDSGKPFAHASQERGTLQGPTLALFETGKPSIVAVYVDGSLNATLLTWNENGQRSLFGHYRKGEKDGVFCLFGANDKLWLIQVYKLGKLQSSHIVEDNVIVKSFEADSNATRDPMLVTATSELESTFSKFKEHERKLKKAVADWDEKRRRALAAENAIAARQNIMDRESTRRANSGAVIGVLREASGLGP
ncbi:MAG TPA: trypsin-like peptidase domain-containing protein [Pirellulales bacterium]|jgi:S1-C subfamily serine protease|nr:trypsin-like peptidase domain-containing protein [Pirellulales bacterium]